MPWYIIKSKSCPADRPWAVVKKTDGKVAGCHDSKQSAREQVKALYANVKEK